MQLIASLAAVVIAYLIGSLSFAVVVSRTMGLADPRTYGSKNPGATNVLRSGNRAAAVLTLLGDAAKGWLAVWLAMRFGPRFGVGDLGIAAVAVAVFIGHLYPVFFGFKGGKGVATAAGVVLALNPWLALATAVTWVIVAFFFRYSSLASIAGAVFAAFYSAFGWGFDERFVALVVVAGFIVYRHRANISNLLAGKERRIGQKAHEAMRARS
ncbi:MAG: glycerol-3-phosphate 1-O-acyltransferase PlsY [Burkholderiaceae bacterium]|jgi:glycerol-3-phosphate acyltransferase PlsY|nr:glycerol-3-phosphate 1-O-acyltransferase PlsY [Burkholderiaceae bacterium]